MKLKISLVLGLVVIAMLSMGATIPYLPEQEERLDLIETKATMSGDGTQSAAGVFAIASGVIVEADVLDYGSSTVRGLKRLVKASWNATLNDQGSSTVDSGLHSLGITLPANSLVTQSWFYTQVQGVDAGTTSGAATLAIQCEDANNIYSANDISGISVGTITAGANTGTAGNMVAAIAADCNVSVQIAGDNWSAGADIIFIEYVLAE